MSASSAASSTLTRARLPIILTSAVVLGLGIYYYLIDDDLETSISVENGSPLHRSNAIRRRRRPTVTTQYVIRTASPLATSAQYFPDQS